MKFGLFGMNMRPCVTPEAIATVARAAEEAGFESFWGGEHLALAEIERHVPTNRRIDRACGKPPEGRVVLAA